MCMKNVLILHGTKGNSADNWFPWLKNKLEKKDWKVWVPDLPNAEKPNLQRYNQHIFGNHNWEFTKDSCLVGHSSGAMAVLGILQALPVGVTVDTCILVGAFKDDLGREDLREIFAKPFDFEYMQTKAKIIFIHSDDDPYCPLDHALYLADQLGAELITKRGQKHFSISTCGEEYRKFPLLVRLLEQ